MSCLVFFCAVCLATKEGDAAVNPLAEGLRRHQLNIIVGEPGRVVETIQQRVGALFEDRKHWLVPFWKGVKGLPATTNLIGACWTGYVDSLDALRHRKANSKTASAFSDRRFAAWDGRLREWINDPAVLEAGFILHPSEETAVHHLCCAINHAEEVGCYLSL